MDFVLLGHGRDHVGSFGTLLGHKLHLCPDFLARVFGVQLAELAQEFLGALVLYLRHLDGYFHDLIATLIFARVEYALLAQPELAAVGRARRNLEQRAAVDGRYFDLGAQAGLGDRDGDADLDVVAVAREERMLLDARGDVEVACGRAHSAGVAFAGDAQARSVLRARRNVHRNGFGSGHAAIAVTRRAGVLQFPFAAAPWAGEIELHGAGHLRHLARAVALRAGHGRAGRGA